MRKCQQRHQMSKLSVNLIVKWQVSYNKQLLHKPKLACCYHLLFLKHFLLSYQCSLNMMGRDCVSTPHRLTLVWTVCMCFLFVCIVLFRGYHVCLSSGGTVMCVWCIWDLDLCIYLHLLCCLEDWMYEQCCNSVLCMTYFRYRLDLFGVFVDMFVSMHV